MNTVLNWMYSACEQSATTVTDQIGADLICELGAEDHQISGMNDVFFHINHLHKEFILMQSMSCFILICSRIK
ncbi:hypothetical protein CAC00_09485 [Raoultella ornithinolytica]|nr:hypothetical protein CAC00_09485 [Raoultella ornithinolytica]UVY41781.1 MAG: hypothetical protein [Bacteriophage sp.]